MPESDDAALADPEHNRPATNTLVGYRKSSNGRNGRDRFFGMDTVVETVPSHPSRSRATRIVPVIVRPETFPVLGRRVLSQGRVRRLIEEASRRVARNKIHPQYPSNPVCLIAQFARVREVYDVLALNATARDSVSH
jgi:hypothetical protein